MVLSIHNRRRRGFLTSGLWVDELSANDNNNNNNSDMYLNSTFVYFNMRLESLRSVSSRLTSSRHTDCDCTECSPVFIRVVVGVFSSHGEETVQLI